MVARPLDAGMCKRGKKRGGKTEKIGKITVFLVMLRGNLHNEPKLLVIKIMYPGLIL